MVADAEMATPLSRRSILLLTAAAIAAALFFLFAGVLPAEFNRDPTGLGRLTGTARLWAPEEQVVAPATSGASGPAIASSTSYSQSFRSDVVVIPLKVAGDRGRGDEVEYKVHVAKGSSYIYSWEVPGIANPEDFYTEFHGHTLDQGKTMTVAYYRKSAGASDNGVLIAPFDGVHGWYFQNQSETPVTVHLRLAGFYDLVPAGQPGNEAGLQAKPVN